MAGDTALSHPCADRAGAVRVGAAIQAKWAEHPRVGEPGQGQKPGCGLGCSHAPGKWQQGW